MVALLSGCLPVIVHNSMARHCMVASLLLGLLIACRPTAISSTPEADVAQYVGAYVTMDGIDTASTELVARCLSRVVGEIENYRPETRIQYDAKLDAAGVPIELVIGLWRSSAPRPQPDQLIHYWFRRDTSYTEIRDPRGTQLQAAPQKVRPFPTSSGYVGLLDALAHALHRAPDHALPVLVLSTTGRTTDAVLKGTDPFIAISMLGATMNAAWTPVAGIDSALLVGSARRIVRRHVPNGVVASVACRTPPLLPTASSGLRRAGGGDAMAQARQGPIEEAQPRSARG
jgi:hypothetical protein